MRSESEMRARALLAAEFDKDEVTAAAARRLRNDNETAVEAGAIRALAAWLASQPQGPAAVGMAAEYQAWIDFFHRGDGDYDDFLRAHVFAAAPAPEGGSHG